jgi:NAD(P)-dependent dehydrogenase (short-subunit alcohol dehydrogenase family)
MAHRCSSNRTRKANTSVGTIWRKVAVVTGSGRGLGLAFAKALSNGRAAVVVNDIDANAAQEAVKPITSGGGQAVAR